MRKKGQSDGLSVQGRFRVAITEDGMIKGDSGFIENQVTNNGIRDYLVDHLLGESETNVDHAGLGTGGAVASNTVDLPNTIDHRGNSSRLVISASSALSGSNSARWTGAFASNDFITTATTVGNIGLFAASNRTVQDLFAGQSFTASTVASNQAINFTYEINFS